jgi:hypothetical protein
MAILFTIQKVSPKHGKSRIIACVKNDLNLKKRKELECPDSEIINFDRTLKMLPTLRESLFFTDHFQGLMVTSPLVEPGIGS